MEEKIHRPPPPSTPREAPWREVEEIIDGLRAVAQKLDIFISLYTGVPPAAPPPAPPVIPIIPAPPELQPVTSRLDALISARATNKATFATGQKDVTTAGTPEQLDDFPVPDGFQATIIARTGNTGYIYVGRTKADCANNKRRFDGLSAGLAVSLRIKNLSKVWVNASVDGDGVSWIVEQ